MTKSESRYTAPRIDSQALDKMLFFLLPKDDLSVLPSSMKSPNARLLATIKHVFLLTKLLSILSKEGPDHEPIFEIELKFMNYKKAFSKARSIKEAEKLAAESFIQLNKIIQ